MRPAALVATSLLCACTMPSVPSTALYERPWPSDDDRASDGSIDLSRFPRGTDAPLRRQLEEALRGVSGFGLASGIFFPFDRPLDPSSLPSVEASSGDPSVLVVALDGPHRGRRSLVDVRFVADAGPFGGTNLLAILPYPGVPLEPRTLHAAVVTTRVRDAGGRTLPPTDATHLETRWLDTIGLPAADVAALTVFRTGDPTRELFEAFDDVSTRHPPRLETTPEQVEVFDDYCVYSALVAMPNHQAGEPPYLHSGGGWARDADRTLALQRWERSRVTITVPRRPAAAARYPAAVFVRTGGGGDRPLVDRGPRNASGRIAPGSGFAADLARAGYVGASFDGPLEGMRNRAAWDEQFVMFNLLNPISMRDTIRQYALELALFAPFLAALDLDASDCPGASPRVLVEPDLVLVAHSNGATIVPLAAAIQPRYHALVLGGAGASWIRQSIHKASPVPTRPLVSLFFGYDLQHETFEHDPMLSLLQWAGEPADPLVYGRALLDRHVLVWQGVLDTYIPPAIANPVTLSLQLDLAGEALDRTLVGHRSIVDDLALVSAGSSAIPVRANRDRWTRPLIQLPADGIEDGHEVMYQQPAAHAQLACFLSTLRDGPPVIATDAACARL